MNDRSPPLDDATMKFGLLMESAQVHQRLAESHLERLRAHTQDLDGVVRDEIRRTLIEELQMLTTESRRATQALQRIGRGAAARGVLWSIVMAILCTGIPIAIMRWVSPSGPGLLRGSRLLSPWMGRLFWDGRKAVRQFLSRPL